MNTSIIRYIVGYILKIEAALLLIPSIVAAIYREPEGLCYLSVSALCIFLGVLLSFRKPKNHVFYLKEGCVATSLSWIVLSFFGSIPFLLTGEITSVPDALFETISGFTTTGASVLNNVEALSHCSLFWRSFTHWVGGMGVHSTERRFAYKSDARRKPGTICGKTGTKSPFNCTDSLCYLFDTHHH